MWSGCHLTIYEIGSRWAGHEQWEDVEDLYKNLHKNGTEVAKWRSKEVTYSSVSLHFGATQNWTQLAQNSRCWYWVIASRLNYLQTNLPNSRSLNRKTHFHQDPKKQGCSSSKPSWCWLLFFRSMKFSMQTSCHKAKLFIKTFTKPSCDVWYVQ